MAIDSREAVWDKAKQLGIDPKIYLHWTAGYYDQLFDSYHINIKGDGTFWIADPDLSIVRSHTWKRNSGSVGIAICCAAGAGSRNLGQAPPTNAQIDGMAMAIAAIADGFWLTIDKAHVMTHGEASANEDGYTKAHKKYAWWADGYGDGDTRGDLEYLGTSESPRYNPTATDGSRGGDVLRGKANWYRNLWKQQKG